MRATIVCTCALSALPLPDTADLTSEGVWTAMGRPARPTQVMAAPITCIVAVTDGDDLGLVLLDDGVDRVRDRAQPEVRRQVLVGAGDADVDEARSTRGVHVDDAQAAARQARVDAHDAHQARVTMSTNMA